MTRAEGRRQRPRQRGGPALPSRGADPCSLQGGRTSTQGVSPCAPHVGIAPRSPRGQGSGLSARPQTSQPVPLVTRRSGSFSR